MLVTGTFPPVSAVEMVCDVHQSETTKLTTLAVESTLAHRSHATVLHPPGTNRSCPQHWQSQVDGLVRLGVVMWEIVTASSLPIHRGECDVRSYRRNTRRYLRNTWTSVRFKPTPTCGPTCKRKRAQGALRCQLRGCSSQPCRHSPSHPLVCVCSSSECRPPTATLHGRTTASCSSANLHPTAHALRLAGLDVVVEMATLCILAGSCPPSWWCHCRMQNHWCKDKMSLPWASLPQQRQKAEPSSLDV